MPKTDAAGPDEPDDDDAPRGRANIAALVFIVLLFAGAYWLFQLLEHHREVQNCIASGRRDCIDLTGDASK